MSAPLATKAKYPFGLSDVKIYPFLDQDGTQLADEGFDLPAAQTFSFADTEDFTPLRGDDVQLAEHGNGATVNWSLEAGGISLQAWAILTGGQIIEAGVAPNRTITLRKCSDDVRPYFQVRGLAMNDNGGDTVGVVYRGKCNGDISGQFGDGAFFVTSADGIGLPIPGTKLLYDFIQHESRTFLALESEAIPLVPPKNVLAVPLSATTAKVIWESVSGYTGYSYQTSANGGTTWAAAVSATDPVANLTALTAATEYMIRIAGKVGTDVGYYGVPVVFTTPA